MAKAKFDLTVPLNQGTKPLYAGVGVTDLVVEVVRDYVTVAQKRAQQRVLGVQKTVTGLDYQPQALREQAAKVVTARVEARRKAVEGRVSELQKRVDDNVAAAGDAYTDLVKRGETLVGRIRRQESTQQTVSSAKTTVAKAKTTRTQASKSTTTAKKAAKKTARKSPARPSAKATKTSATKTASSAARAVVDAGSKVGD